VRVHREGEERQVAAQDASSVRQTAEAIRAYLRAHPRVADSAEGVARWWLGGAAVDVVEEALRRLVLEGAVRVETLPGGRPLYRAGLDESE
jgi:hypothetical protein